MCALKVSREKTEINSGYKIGGNAIDYPKVSRQIRMVNRSYNTTPAVRMKKTNIIITGCFSNQSLSVNNKY